MIEPSKKQDEQMYGALLSLPSFPFHQLIRLRSEEAAAHRSSFERYQDIPQFHYPHAQEFDVEEYATELHQLTERLPDLVNNPVVRKLYARKLAELKKRSELIYAIQQQNDEGVTHLSTELYGENVAKATHYAREFAEMLEESSEFHEHSRPVDAVLFKKMAEVLFLHYGITNWGVMMHSGSSLRVKRGMYGRGRVFVPKNLLISRARAARLLTHEIEVHVLRALAGSIGPLNILSRGLDNYLVTEEGLAVWAQMQMHQDRPKHTPGFWDGWACALALEGDFLHVYHTLRQARRVIHEKVGRPDANERAKDAAWRLCLRVYRGIHHPHKAGLGYMRDHLYRTGLAKVEAYLAQNENQAVALRKLYVGKIGIEHIDLIDKLNLSPAITSEFISRNVVESFFYK